MDFDEDLIYYSHQNLQQQPQQPQQQQPGQIANEASLATVGGGGRVEEEEERAVDTDALRRHFREFLREFYKGFIHLVHRDVVCRSRNWFL